jgi:stress-induced morphogen
VVEEIRESLAREFPGATIDVADQTGANDHFGVTVVAEAFAGKSLVERHQMVYRALGALMPRIHALQLKTVTPTEH